MTPTTPILAALLLLTLAPPTALAAGQEAAESVTPAESRPEAATRPLGGSAVEATYALGPEDVIQVFVWKEPELSTRATVRPDGRIALPLAGELMASGSTPRELEQEITKRLERYIEMPVVTVMVEAINSPKVSVLGEVRRPGRFLIAQRTTVLDAIAMSGGFTEFARRGRVAVLRPTSAGVQRIPIDVKHLLQDGGSPFYLQPGDTLHVD
ncbi:MAG TPA: polysaccharide biosynthesis/export family protein [Thermoanaerobaculia bacterium]|nr:polysaccharide biosynthesis/export family protein [Thermoanaerobaculia bacterium]